MRPPASARLVLTALVVAGLADRLAGGRERGCREGCHASRGRRDLPGPALREVDPGLPPGEPGRRHRVRGRGQRRGPAALSGRRGRFRRQRRGAQRRADGAARQAGARLVPVTAGIVVLAYNVPGLTRPLRLSREVCADIFAGRIRTWADPRIRAANPGLDLPNRSIAVDCAPGRQWNHLRPHQSPQRRQRGLARPGPRHRQSRRLARHGDAGAGQRGYGGPHQGQRVLDRLPRVPLRPASWPRRGPPAKPRGALRGAGRARGPDGADEQSPAQMPDEPPAVPAATRTGPSRTRS